MLEGIRHAGFDAPTEVQETTIPLFLQGKDIIVQAKTGTGKTAAFGVPLLQMIDTGQDNLRALIMTPTRELAAQVGKEISKLGEKTGIRVLCVYGGTSLENDRKQLARHPHILVATPGRLIDLHKRGEIDFKHLQFWVLDEADKMMEMGFLEDIEWVASQLPKERQTLLFSATMPGPIKDIARAHMKDYQEINHSQDTLTVEGVQQFYILVDGKHKINLLLKLITGFNVQKGMVFCKTKRFVDIVSRELSKRKIPNTAIHGSYTQKRREQALERFNNGQSRVLVATDIASRGLHIHDVTHVINIDFPGDPDTYVHRVGRTARQGRTGMAVTMITNLLEQKDLQQIEHKIGAPIVELVEER